MGSSSSRQRPQPNQPVQYPYQQPVYAQNASPQAPAYGPPVPFGNGQYYGGFVDNRQFMPPMITAPVNYPRPPPGGHLYGQQYQVPTQEFQQTATIKNPVNLKKHTLRLVQGNDDKELYSLEFAFDASTPCRASVFVHAVEETNQACQLTTTSSIPPCQPAYYESGMGLPYPSALATSAEAGGPAGGALQLREAQLAGLAGVSGTDIFALVVRLETLTDEGRAEGRRLSDLPPGAALPLWVQAQSSYAGVKRQEDGTWGLTVLKQKIWVRNVSYELQEIYGMESNRVTNIAAGYDDIDGRDCVICMNAERDTTVLPCRHMCMCSACAHTLKLMANKCPICRNDIESLLQIKMPPNKDSTAATPEPAPCANTAVLAETSNSGDK